MSSKSNKYFLNLVVTSFLFVSTFVTLIAQETDTIIPIDENPEKILRKIDIREVTQNGFNFWQDKFTGHWAGIDLGFNTFLNKDYSGYDSDFMDNDILRSNSVYINVIQQSIGLQHNRNTIGFVTGLGVQFQNYQLDQNTTIERLSNDVIVPKELNYHENQKSKLSIFSITMPLLTEFQIPINNYKNRLYLSTGLFLSYRLGSHTKIKYKTDHKEKLKVPDHYSLQNFKYGFMFRAGYRWINVFASYELTTFYKENKGPELTPFTFGFTLLQF
ncbi:MAG: hypothetical protein GQ525_04185 [Draconibacterium sp.]|nr:hypothetical protein [Draconibacterium sp.]